VTSVDLAPITAGRPYLREKSDPVISVRQFYGRHASPRSPWRLAGWSL
jgi:hypothetical protein